LPEIKATAMPKQGSWSAVNSFVFSGEMDDFSKAGLLTEEIGRAQPEVVVFSHWGEVRHSSLSY
jgi:hypothetical protein